MASSLPPEDWHSDPELQVLAHEVYTCYDQGHLDQAIAHLDRAIAKFPQRAFLYSERANFRKLLQDYSGALLDYTQAIRLDPLNPLFHLWRSRVYAKLGDDERAIEDYNIAFQLNPKLTQSGWR